MVFIDIVFLLTLLVGAYQGWTSGLLKQLVSLFGVLIGLLVATACYASLGKFLMPQLGMSPTISNVIAFVILWIVVPIVLGAVISLPSRWMRGHALGVLNNILGACTGVIKYAILLVFVIWVMKVIGLVHEKQAEDSIAYSAIEKVIDVVSSPAEQEETKK